MATEINRLNQKQQGVVDKIIKFGREVNASDRVIQAAINIANAESTFESAEVSADSVYKGMFQYCDNTWVANYNVSRKKILQIH